MKKRLVMKKWVEVVLLIVLFIGIIIGMSDTKNEELFIVSHIVDMVVMVLIGVMFFFYGRELD